MAGEPHKLDPLVQELKIQITLHPEQGKRTFTSYNELKEFIDGEVAFWEQFQSAERLKDIAQTFTQVQQKLQQAGGMTEKPQQSSTIMGAVNVANQGHLVVYSSTSFAKFLNSLRNQNIATAQAAYDYHRNRIQQGMFGTQGYLNGIVYSVLWQHGSDFLDARLRTEQEALSELRAEVEKTRGEIETQYAKLTNETAAWKDRTEKNLAQFEETTKKETTDHVETTKEKLEAVLNDWKKRMEEQETLHREQMRLKGPADHWNTLREDYRKAGLIWAGAAVATALAVVIGIGAFLESGPDWFLDPAMTFTAPSIRGTIIIFVALSLFVYLFALFVKLSTSAFHLERDARERFQLTHVYLSLIHEKAVETKEREIVLQALFSRADTGLLKGDSSPTMPGLTGIVEALRRMGK